MQQALGLVDPQSFAFADYRGRKPGRWLYSIGLAVYDLMAGQRTSRYVTPDELLLLAGCAGWRCTTGLAARRSRCGPKW